MEREALKSTLASHSPNLFMELETLAKALREAVSGLDSRPVNPRPSHVEIASKLQFHLGKTTLPLGDLIERFTKDMAETLLRVDHPMYFGVFNPNPLFPGVIAEALVAQLNPQLASSASARFAIDCEKRVLCYLGEKAGFDPSRIDGTFCSGGTEANMTAILTALARRMPEYFTHGLSGSSLKPAIYVSSETHHSFQKSARILGLGPMAIRVSPVDADLRFDVSTLRQRIESDKAQGFKPILVVGTLGSTSAGAIDPLTELADVAAAHTVDFHIDAAWGGAALLLPELNDALKGVERADSITIDAHKWFAAPMTAGIFISRHPGSLRSVFEIEESPYMPPSSFSDTATEPFRESLGWSRRFSGLKVLFNLLTFGEEGYQTLFRRSFALAMNFRTRLEAEGWEIVARSTKLPIVCFRPKGSPSKVRIEAIAERLNASGKAWVTTTVVGEGKTSVLRVGFPNFATDEEHVAKLMELLKAAQNAATP
jgi:glutamate/tyrosine decarboxylase-like PLP-dependent enzyme